MKELRHLDKIRLNIEPQVRVQPDVDLLPDRLGLALADERLIPQRQQALY